MEENSLPPKRKENPAELEEPKKKKPNNENNETSLNPTNAQPLTATQVLQLLHMDKQQVLQLLQMDSEQVLQLLRMEKGASLTVENFQQPFATQFIGQELKGQPLKDFLNLQEEAPIVDPIERSEGLFITKTISRDTQLDELAQGILKQFCIHQLGLNRAQDHPLFEIRGPVGSGKTHFMLNATKEIAKRLTNSKWLEEYFTNIWTNSYRLGDELYPPTNWRTTLVEALENSVKTFATQRNGTGWHTSFTALTASQYIAATLAINHLTPTENHKFKIDNFKSIALNLDSVLNLIREKYKKQDKLLILEFYIDEVQNLIEGKSRKKSKCYELVSALHTLSTTTRDLLFIPVIGGTTFPDSDSDALYNLNFVTLSGVANQIITLNTLKISHTIDLIKKEFPLVYEKLMQINIEELANLLLLIGPFPRCIELLVRELQTSKDTLIIAHNIYNAVKSRLLLKYSAKKESMLVDNPKEIVKILQHILEGRKGLTDATAQKALMRGLICYEKSGIVSVIFVYLHIATCDNALLKNEFDVSFLDQFYKAILTGSAHARLMEELIASFISMKVSIYHYLEQKEVNAATFFAGALMGTKVSNIVLKFNQKMNCRTAKYCTDHQLQDIRNIDLADGSVVDMTQHPTALVVANQWSRGDGIVSFNDTQALVYETKKQKSTPCCGVDVKDSFEYEQKMFQTFESNLPEQTLFLYCNSGVTTTTQNGQDLFTKVASDYSMLVNNSNWAKFFRIIPKIYVTATEKRKLIDRVDSSHFQQSSPTIVIRPTEQLDIKQEIEEIDFFCAEEI